jgi:hypothetical protein
MLKQCNECGKGFETRVFIDGIKRDLYKRSKCLDCMPFGSTRLTPDKMVVNTCLGCGNRIHHSYKYCDNSCQQKHSRDEKVMLLLSGVNVSWDLRTIKNVLIYYFKHHCFHCKLENWMGKLIPLEVHHIDGNPSNNIINNLDLICPNCHALTDNYRSKNKKRQ